MNAAHPPWAWTCAIACRVSVVLPPLSRSRSCRGTGRQRWRLRVEWAIERAVLHRFRDMAGADAFACLEIGDGARHLEDAIVRTRRELERGQRGAQELRRVRGEHTV